VTSRKCEKATTKVYEYIDREMSWRRRTIVRWHLRRCPPCHDGFDFEGRLKARVREGCMDEMPAELDARLRAFLKEHGASFGG
jgi:mycothiol system anti-sigma-R factor